MEAQRQVAIYTRVSTSKQSCSNQREDLLRVARSANWFIAAEFSDQAVSGAASRDERPALRQLMLGATRREFELVMVWSIDRLGRSVQHLVETMNELHALKIDLFFHQQAIDTTTATGKLCFSIFGALAEYERAMIRDRVVAGQQRARAQGVKLGRPTRLNESVRSAVVCLRERGMSIAAIARQLGIGVGTIYKCLPQSPQIATGMPLALPSGATDIATR